MYSVYELLYAQKVYLHVSEIFYREIEYSFISVVAYAFQRFSLFSDEIDKCNAVFE